MTRVLLIGIKPEAVDFADPDLPPGITAATIAAGIAATLADMKARGWEAGFCSVPAHDGVATKIAGSRAERWDCIVIGGGIPPSLPRPPAVRVGHQRRPPPCAGDADRVRHVSGRLRRRRGPMAEQGVMPLTWAGGIPG